MAAQANDVLLQKVLRKYGTIIGNMPFKWALSCIVIALAVSVPGWCNRKLFGGSKDLTSPESLNMQWSVKGSDTQKQIQMWDERHGSYDHSAWEKKYQITMFVSKNKYGDDILTKESMKEQLELHAKWRSLSVEVNGLTYTTDDLCDRGILPDLPNTSTGEVFTPTLPCQVVSALQCFKEFGDYNHPSYQAIDPNIKSVLGETAVSYSTKPSLEASTTSQVKTIVSNKPNAAATGSLPEISGCIGFDQAAFFSAATWAGRESTWNGDIMNNVPALRTLYQYDGPGRVAYRLQLSKPTHTNQETIKEAMKKHSALWMKTCKEQHDKNTHVEVSNFEPWAYGKKKLEDKNSQQPWAFTIPGGVLMSVFVTVTMGSWRHPMASRVSLGSMGLLLVVFSLIISFGVYFLAGKYLNNVIMLAVPLLAVGLGVDDMFVLIRYFSDLGFDFVAEHTIPAILTEVMVRAGPGVLLTSTCNCLGFGSGIFLPIGAISDFCLASCIVSACNIYIMLNVFMPILAIEAQRIKNKEPEMALTTFVCQKKTLAAAPPPEEAPEVYAMSTKDYASHPEKKLTGFLETKYGPFLAKPLVNIVLCLLIVGTVIAACFAIRDKSIGYRPADLFDKEEPENRGLELIFDAFGLFPGYLCFHDIDVAANQKHILQTYDSVASTALAAAFVVPNYLTMAYTVWLGGHLPFVNPNLTQAEKYPAAASMAGFDMSWTHPTLAPVGTLPANTFYPTFNALRKFPANPAWGWGGAANQSFMYMDLAQVSEFAPAEYNDNGVLKHSFTFMAFQRIGLTTEDDFVTSIKQTQDAVDASPIKDNAFIYDDDVATYWTVFLELDAYMWKIFAADGAIVFVVTLLVFSFDFVTALLTTVVCALIVIEIYGLSVLIVSFNIFTAAFALMAMGLSVEFTAHFAAAFSLEKGTPADRLGYAMSHTFPALVEGSISTMLSILPMAFYPALFSVKYVFGILSMVVAVGFLNGFVAMPALTALCTPLFNVQDRLRGKKQEAIQ